jgi:hypothetical protein
LFLALVAIVLGHLLRFFGLIEVFVAVAADVAAGDLGVFGPPAARQTAPHEYSDCASFCLKFYCNQIDLTDEHVLSSDTGGVSLCFSFNVPSELPSLANAWFTSRLVRCRNSYRSPVVENTKSPSLA